MEEKARIQEELKKNDLAAKEHIDVLKEAKTEKIQSGGCAEYSNMIVSVFNQDNMKTSDLYDKIVKDFKDRKDK